MGLAFLISRGCGRGWRLGARPSPREAAGVHQVWHHPTTEAPRLARRREPDHATDMTRAVSTPLPRWSATVQAVRRHLGVLTSRARRRCAGAATLPTGQQGDFVVCAFDSKFEARVGATFETIAMSNDDDGQWRVIWYDVK